MNPRSTLAIVPLLAAAAGCSVGQGTGDVQSDALYAHQCWGTPPTMTNPTMAMGAPYDMQPTFFAADPYRNTLTIRIQRGSDITEFSDGLEILIDDIPTIQNAIAGGGTSPPASGDGGTPDGGSADAGTSDAGAGDAGTLPPLPPGASFRVDLPAGLHPPGSQTNLPPDLAANPPIVHMALYLEDTCHNQNVILYSVDGSITFTAIFDGNIDETSASNKLSAGTFDVQLGDLSDVPFGAYAGAVPPGLQSRFTGNFSFYFERGQPAQPFP